MGAGIVRGEKAAIHIGKQDASSTDLDPCHRAGRKSTDIAYLDKTV